VASSEAHFSGEGHLIEAEILGDTNNTIRPVVCDSDGRLLVDLAGTVVDIGIVQIEDSVGNPLTSVAGSLNVNVTNPVSVTGSVNTNPPANATTNITEVGGAPLSEGQKTMANSVPVVIASDQSAIPVTGTFTTSPNVNVHDASGNPINSTGTSLNVDVTNFPATQPVSGTVTALQGTSPWVTSLASTTITGTVAVTESGTWSVGVNNFPATQSVTQGTSPWVISGTVTTTPPANASTNLTEVGGAAISEGQKLMAASIPVVIASDQSAIAVTGTITTSPNVNVHDGSGNTIASTGTSLNVDVTNTVPVTMTSTAITGTVAVTESGTWNVGVTNFPATQPVSGTVTAIQPTGTNLHTITDTGSTTAVTGNVTVVQPTGTNLHVVNDASSAVIGHVITDTGSTTTVTGTTAVNLTQLNGGALGSGSAYGTSPGAVTVPGVNAFVTNPVVISASNLGVTATGAAAAAVTLTLPAVAALAHYISMIEIVAYTTAARTGGVTPVLVTSTNLPGSNVWDFQTAAAVGTSERQVFTPNSPIRSSVVNTNTTIVCPATASIIWRVNVYYFTGV